MATLESIYERCTPSGDGCLLWQGAITNATGYSRIGHEGDVWLGHRLVFTLGRRPLEPGEHVDHLCFVRRCLALDHLEAVSQAENNRRASMRAAQQRKMCKKGLHPWVPENIAVTGSLQVCRACKSDRQQKYDLRTRGPGKLSQRPVNPVWASLGLQGCRECGSDQNSHKRDGLCFTCINRRRTGAQKRQRQNWLSTG